MSKDTRNEEVTPFSLRTDSSFVSRAVDVFGGLTNIEAKHDAHYKARSRSQEGREDAKLLKEEPGEDFWTGPSGCHTSTGSGPSKSKDFSDERSRGPKAKDQICSGFKRPRGIPPGIRKGPSHSRDKRQRDQWTYYNLSDVSSESMSERSNTATALSFLQDHQRQSSNKKQKTDHDRIEQHESMHTDEGSLVDADPRRPQHVFKSSRSHSADVTSTECTPTIQIAGRPGCIVMPEYTVGQKAAKPKIAKRLNPNENKEKKLLGSVSMSHLQEDCEQSVDKPETKCFDDIMQPKSNRTFFNSCGFDNDDDNDRMDDDSGSVLKSESFSFKKGKNKSIRSRRHSDDNDNEEVVNVDTKQSLSVKKTMDLDGVD